MATVLVVDDSTLDRYLAGALIQLFLKEISQLESPPVRHVAGIVHIVNRRLEHDLLVGKIRRGRTVEDDTADNGRKIGGDRNGLLAAADVKRDSVQIRGRATRVRRVLVYQLNRFPERQGAVGIADGPIVVVGRGIDDEDIRQARLSNVWAASARVCDIFDFEDKPCLAASPNEPVDT